VPVSDILSIGKTALMANQSAIRTTSNNISNVNTPGYSRQRVLLNPQTPVREGAFILGNGVDFDGVERVFDKFIQTQILDANETLSMFNSRYDALRRLENVFNDAKDMGLDGTLSAFFGSLQDLALEPQSYAARSTVMASASTLADRINLLDTRIKDEIRTVDGQIADAVADVNDLTRQIADLNVRIQEIEDLHAGANELRDQRDMLIRELSGYMDIMVLEDADGLVNILTAQGSSLVAAGIGITELGVSGNVENHGYNDIMLGNFNITESISSGKIRGLLDARDITMRDTLDRINMLSASLTKEFNLIHSAGFGLDGSTGLDFFSPLNPAVTLGAYNTGTASGSASVLNPATLTLDDYEIKFTSPTTFNIHNVTTDTVVSVGNAYVSGANIDFDGLRVVITDSPGTPLAGDTYRINVTEGAARDFAMVLTDPEQLAAAKTLAAIPGDNTNVLDMIALETSFTLGGGTTTFYGYYTRIVADIGSATAYAGVEARANETVAMELENYRESISGVSMDEEGVNLIKYQRAYEAAAKVITTVDSMLATLINMR
jgi:flagellar hook-associated protein 1 FlgK